MLPQISTSGQDSAFQPSAVHGSSRTETSSAIQRTTLLMKVVVPRFLYVICNGGSPDSAGSLSSNSRPAGFCRHCERHVRVALETREANELGYPHETKNAKRDTKWTQIGELEHHTEEMESEERSPKGHILQSRNGTTESVTPSLNHASNTV